MSERALWGEVRYEACTVHVMEDPVADSFIYFNKKFLCITS